MTYGNTFEQLDGNQASLVRRACVTAKRIAKKWRTRQAMSASLGGLSNRALRDIGLTAADVESAIQQAFEETKTEELSEIARRQSRNW